MAEACYAMPLSRTSVISFSEFRATPVISVIYSATRLGGNVR